MSPRAAAAQHDYTYILSMCQEQLLEMIQFRISYVTGQTYMEKVVFMRSEKRSKDAERANRRMEAPLSEKERISTTFS